MQQQLSYESRVELARLRASIGITGLASVSPVVDAKDDWLPGISEPEDVGLQVTPEVAVAKGVHWDVSGVHRIMEPGNPFATICVGAKRLPVEENDAAAQKRRGMDDEEFRYVRRKTLLKNGDLDTTVLARWNQPDDVLDAMDGIADLNGQSLDLDTAGFYGSTSNRATWVERMTAFRETQLRRLLREYFQSDRYMDREIVLKWKQQNGRWVPEKKMLVRDWVAQQIEERGSRLAGFSACAGTIRSKITRRIVSRDATGQSGGAWWKTYNDV